MSDVTRAVTPAKETQKTPQQEPPKKVTEPTVQPAGNQAAKPPAATTPVSAADTPQLDAVAAGLDDGDGKSNKPAPPPAATDPGSGGPPKPNDPVDAPPTANDETALQKAKEERVASERAAAAAKLAQEKAAAAAKAQAASDAAAAQKAAEAKAAADKAAAEAAAAQKAAADKAAAEQRAVEERNAAYSRARAMYSELHDAVGDGAFNANDAGATKRLLAGKTPVEMEAIRAIYKSKTGENLETHVWEQFSGKDGNEMMSNVLSGMSLRDKVNYYETGKSMQNLLKHASPEELETLGKRRSVLTELKGKMSEDDYMKARIKLYPNEAQSAVAERIRSANNVWDDNEGAAMTAFASLPVKDRKQLLADNPNIVHYMDSTERQRFKDIALSESAALIVRMEQATIGAGTDDDHRKEIAKDAGRLHAEEKALNKRLADPNLSQADKADVQARLKEMGNVSGLLKPKRNMDGSLRSGTFLGRLNDDVKDAEMHAHMREMGIPEREVAKQVILDAVGINDDERGIQEAFAKVPKDQRMSLYMDPDVNRVMKKHLNSDELALVSKFRDNDILAMSTERIDHADGFFSQDEAGVIKSVMDMDAADRKTFGGTDLAKTVRANMDRKEQAAFDEAMKTGTISLETGMAAASGGNWDGTNEELMNLVSATKSTEETLEIRKGYVYARDGLPANPTKEQIAARDKFNNVEKLFKRELGTDAMQEQLDGLTDHVGPKTNEYKGPVDPEAPVDPKAPKAVTSQEVERSTAEGRKIAVELERERGLEKMTDDGEGGGRLAAFFSDTDETAVQSHQETLREAREALVDNKVSEEEVKGVVDHSATFKEDFKAMVEAQNTVTEVAGTTAAVVAGVVVAVASGGTAIPFISAAVAQYGAVATSAVLIAAAKVGTKELFGGDRYDATGADGATDIALSAADAVTANASGKLGQMAVTKLAGKYPGIFAAPIEEMTGAALRQGTTATLRQQAANIVVKNTVSEGINSAANATRDTVIKEEFWRKNLGDMVSELGTNVSASMKNALRDAVIGGLVDGGTTAWHSQRLKGFMSSLETGGMARADVDAMSFGDIKTLGTAQRAVDAGDTGKAAKLIEAMKVPDAQKAQYMEALRTNPDAKVPAATTTTLETTTAPIAETSTPPPAKLKNRVSRQPAETTAPKVEADAPKIEADAPKVEAAAPKVDVTPSTKVDTTPGSAIDGPATPGKMDLDYGPVQRKLQSAGLDKRQIAAAMDYIKTNGGIGDAANLADIPHVGPAAATKLAQNTGMGDVDMTRSKPPTVHGQQMTPQRAADTVAKVKGMSDADFEAAKIPAAVRDKIRSSNFNSPQDLAAIDGIGPARMEALSAPHRPGSEMVKVGGAWVSKAEANAITSSLTPKYDVTDLRSSLDAAGIKGAQKQALLRHAKENGSLPALDNVTDIHGVGPKTLEKLTAQDVQLRVDALVLPPSITEQLDVGGPQELAAASLEIENGDYASAMERLGALDITAPQRHQILGNMLKQHHGPDAISYHPEFQNTYPKQIADALSLKSNVARDAAVPGIIEHFDKAGQGAAANALRRLNGNSQAQIELARDLAIYQDVTTRRASVDIQDGKAASTHDVITDYELESMMDAHQALASNLDVDNPVLRKAIDPGAIHDMLGMTRGGKPQKTTKIAGFHADPANTEGLTSHEAIRSTGLDYNETSYVTSGVTPDANGVHKWQSKPDDTMMFVDSAATPDMLQDSKVPVLPEYLERMKSLAARRAADGDTRMQAFVDQTFTDKPHDLVDGKIDTNDPFSGTGAHTPGKRVELEGHTLNQERKFSGAHDLADGARMRALQEDGAVFDTATYSVDEHGQGSWAPNLHMSEAQFKRVKSRLPADMRNQIQEAIANRKK